MRTAFRGIRSRACTWRVGPPSEGREEDACDRTARAVCASAAALVHSFVLGGAACPLLGHRRPVRPSDRDGRRAGACCACGRSGAAPARSAAAILGYFEDGPDLVTMAMNGWADPEPAWWLNLQAHPDVIVDLPGGSRAVRARAADADERPRLWARWAAYDKDLDAYAARSTRQRSSSCRPDRPPISNQPHGSGPATIGVQR